MLPITLQLLQIPTVRVELLNYFMPIFMFLFVFALMFAFLAKTKILGEAPFTNILVAFVLAIIFVATPAAVEFTNVITPWIVVFFVVLFFIFLIYAWPTGDVTEVIKDKPFISWFIFIILIFIFIFGGVKAFGPILSPFAPGIATPTNLTPQQQIGFQIRDVVFHPAVLGIGLLFIIAATTAWVLGQKTK